MPLFDLRPSDPIITLPAAVKRDAAGESGRSRRRSLAERTGVGVQKTYADQSHAGPTLYGRRVKGRRVPRSRRANPGQTILAKQSWQNCSGRTVPAKPKATADAKHGGCLYVSSSPCRLRVSGAARPIPLPVEVQARINRAGRTSLRGEVPRLRPVEDAANDADERSPRPLGRAPAGLGLV